MIIRPGCADLRLRQLAHQRGGPLLCRAEVAALALDLNRQRVDRLLVLRRPPRQRVHLLRRQLRAQRRHPLLRLRRQLPLHGCQRLVVHRRLRHRNET